MKLCKNDTERKIFMPKNFPESKQPKGTFSWIAQQPAKPLCYAPRPITPKENLRRVFSGETPMWMPLWLKDSQYCWPDVVLEHPAYEKDGKAHRGSRLPRQRFYRSGVSLGGDGHHWKGSSLKLLFDNRLQRRRKKDDRPVRG